MAASNQYTPNLSNHNPENYNRHANFVYSAKNTSAVLGLLEARPGERIVDLGCGSGELTLQLRELVGDTGHIHGIDSSEDMLVKARTTGGPKGIVFSQGDIQDHTTLDPKLEGSFDAVFSSATLHWCKANPGGVVETIKWLLKPGGRAAFEFGGFGNCIGVRAALWEVLRRRKIDPAPRDPWYFPTPQQYRSLLHKHGLEVGDVTNTPRPTPLPTDLVGWLETFARKTFFTDIAEDEAQEMLAEVAELCRPDHYWNNATPGQGDKPASKPAEGEDGWEIMYVRLRGTATKRLVG